MAWADLTAEQKAMVVQFTRDYRAAVADTVRGLRQQQLLATAYTTHISAIWDQISDANIIPDGTGLGGADLEMTKADFADKFAWTVNLLGAVYSDAGGAVATAWPDKETVDAYGVQLAGPTNIG